MALGFVAKFAKDEFGHQAEAVFLAILAKIGVDCRKADDFEDERRATDFWVSLGTRDIPIQFSINNDDAKWVEKLLRCRRFGVAPVYIPWSLLRLADPSSAEFSEKALKEVVRSVTLQVTSFQKDLQRHGRTLQTPQECRKAERHVAQHQVHTRSRAVA